MLILLLGAGCTTSQYNAKNENAQTSQTNPNLGTIFGESAMKLTYQGKLPDEKIIGKQARISTEKGDIVFDFLPDVAPVTVSNFIYLAESGFYDGLTFHRREEGFVIQGGDPAGNGTGGPGYNIPAEFNSTSHDRGVVAMARSNHPDSAGSQFYITLAPANFLDGNYTVFGKVVSGMEVVDEIQVGDVMTKVVIESAP